MFKIQFTNISGEIMKIFIYTICCFVLCHLTYANPISNNDNAFDSFKFGESPSVVNDKIAKNKKISLSYAATTGSNKMIFCTTTVYDQKANAVLVFDKSNELNKIIVYFEKYNGDSFTIKLEENWRNLKSKLELALGIASSHNKFPDISFMKVLKMYITDVWGCKDKTISLNVAEFNGQYRNFIIIASCPGQELKSVAPAPKAEDPGKAKTQPSVGNKAQAYANFYFGDSCKTVHSKIKNSNKVSFCFEEDAGEEPIDIESICGKMTLAGKPCSIIFCFNNSGKLVKLFMHYPEYLATLFDSKVKPDWKTMRDIIMKKYKQPSKSFQVPRSWDIKTGTQRYTDIWLTDDKKISVGFVCNDKSYYFSFIEIVDPEYEKQEEARKNAKKKSQTASEAENF